MNELTDIQAISLLESAIYDSRGEDPQTQSANLVPINALLIAIEALKEKVGVYD